MDTANFSPYEGDPMTIDLTFDGSTALLGMRGWHQLGSALLYVIPEYQEVVLELRTCTEMESAPTMLHIYNPEELRTLICGLAKALAQMTTITTKEN
jgi:hypothetical protein